MEERQSTFVALWKVLRWVILIVMLFAIFAAMRRPSPIAAEAPPEAIQTNSQAFDAKLQQLSDAHERGQSSEARFTAEEVNAVITRTMQETPQVQAAATLSSQPEQTSGEAEAATPGTPGGAPVRTVQVAFQGSEVTGQFASEIHGKEVYITLSGRLGSKDGYVTFEPTSFKLGNLVVPVSWMSETFQQKLAEPENREKLRLPDFIASLRVENGELVITEK
jgi:hypothetical protein